MERPGVYSVRLFEKYKSLSAQPKAAIWYTICSFAQKGISYIVVPIYVRILSTGEYGEWAVFQSWAGILIVFASLNLYCGVYTKTIVDMQRKEERDRYTASMQGLGTMTTLLMLIVYMCSISFSNKVLELNTPFVLLLFVYFLAYPAFCFWGARQRVEYKYKTMVFVTIIVSILTPTCSLLLLYYTNLRAKALILGFLIVQCVVGLYFYVIQFIRGKCFFDKEYWKYAAKFNIPLIPHYLSLIVLNQSDRIMIKHYCGDSDAGVYSFAYQIASVITLLITSINGARSPWTYEKLRNKEYDGLRKITNVLVVLLMGGTLLFSLFAPEIVKIIGTKEYASAMYVIPVVAVGIFFTFVYDVYASIEFYFGATKYVMFASVVGAVLNLILNAICIPQYGFIAAAYTTLICYLAFALMHYLFSRKVLSRQAIDKSVYDDGIIGVLSVGMIVIGLGVMLSYEHTIFRIALIAGLVFGCWMGRKKLIGILVAIRR